MKKDDRLYRVVTFLNRDEMEFLDDVIKDIYFNYGIKIPRAKLIEEIVEGFRNQGEKDKQKVEKDLLKRFCVENAQSVHHRGSRRPFEG